MMHAERKIARELAESMADDRAHRIASAAAKELIRSEGEAVSHETDEGYIVVQFGDFTIGD